MVSANGSVKATPTLTFSGVTYYRWFQQTHIDGNLIDAADVRPRPSRLSSASRRTTRARLVGTPTAATSAFDADARLRLPRPHLAERQ